MDEKTWYLCDPKKNTGCRKASCWWYDRGRCALTSKPETAVEYTDGRPIRVKILRTAAGFRLELVKE